MLQIAEWATEGFGPTDGGYASVYVGWTGLYAVFVLAVVFWLETLLATAIRYRKTERACPAAARARFGRR